MARRANVVTFSKRKRKSHPHSKNASRGQTGYKKPYKGQGRNGQKKKMKNPCWKGFVAYGMKKGKGGKPVPNCVPKKK